MAYQIIIGKSLMVAVYFVENFLLPETIAWKWVRRGDESFAVWENRKKKLGWKQLELLHSERWLYIKNERIYVAHSLWNCTITWLCKGLLASLSSRERFCGAIWGLLHLLPEWMLCWFVFVCSWLSWIRDFDWGGRGLRRVNSLV